MTDENLNEFTAFLERRHAAAAQFVCGDDRSFLSMVSRERGSFFSPMGPIFDSSDAVVAQYARAAANLRRGEYRFEPLAFGCSATLGWLVGIQRGSLSGTVQDRLPQLDLRVTEIFQREGKDWKLIHRHADRLQA